MGDAALLDGHHPTLWLLVTGVVALHIGAFLYWCYAYVPRPPPPAPAHALR